MAEALVIGSGPAGLMAAEALADGGLAVTVADSKPSFGRKFLMAGKSGLNLTMAEDTEAFLHKMHPSAPLAPMLRSFGPEDVQDFSRALGQEVFTGSSGRVFPLSMKASPLLRAWLNRLSSKGVRFETRWRWQGWEGRNTVIETPDGLRHLTPDVLVLALGGGVPQTPPPTNMATIIILATIPARAQSEIDWFPKMPFLSSGIASDWSPKCLICNTTSLPTN